MKNNRAVNIIKRGGVFTTSQHKHDARAIAQGLTVLCALPHATPRNTERNERINIAWIQCVEQIELCLSRLSSVFAHDNDDNTLYSVPRIRRNVSLLTARARKLEMLAAK